MLNIGCHLSTSGGFEGMGTDALSIGANTFQFFTRNPRGGKAKDIDPDDVLALQNILDKHSFSKILAHAPYTLNAASADIKVRSFAKSTMIDDIRRMEYFPNSLYNFHPGSHVGQGVGIGIDFIVDMLNEILTAQQTTIVLLETMAGKGSEIGRTFEELQEILDRVELKDKMGVCLDTCHIYDAGYDIVNDLDGVLNHFDNVVGLDKLYAIHLNDSLNPFKSHKDRHAIIGEGTIGFDAIVKVINHSKLFTLPFYLETPNDLAGHAIEITKLRAAYQY